MKNVLIVERQTEALNRVNEEAEVGKQARPYLLGGVFTEFGVLNRNQRVYTPEKFIPALNGLIQEMRELGVVYGELDHPENFDSALQRTSHAIKHVEYVAEKNRVDGKIDLLSTHWGKEARAIVNDGYPLFVSSRAAGVTNENGNVEIKKLFTYDIVSSPGFSSAKMESVNENLGFGTDTNFRIYEISNESKINELFNMNKNEQITKTQLTDYSQYMISEIKKTKNELHKAIKEGAKYNPEKVEKLYEYYDSLNTDYTKLSEYVKYLAEKLTILVNDKNETKKTINKLIEHNDYLAEQLENTIEYSNYLAEELDNTIVYSEYIAEQLDNSIEYSEYVAEQLDNTIEYTEYIAENLDNSIEYTEYIAENLDNSIVYGDYIAEQLETSVQYTKKIATMLNENSKIFESSAEQVLIPMPEDFGFNGIETEDEIETEEDNIEGENILAPQEEEIVEPISDVVVDPTEIIQEPNSDVIIDTNSDVVELGEVPAEMPSEVAAEMPVDGEIAAEMPVDGEIPAEMPVAEMPVDGEIPAEMPVDGEIPTEEPVEDEIPTTEEPYRYESKVSGLTSRIDSLLEKVKIQAAVKNTDYNFLKLLNKPQVDSFYDLDETDKQKVIVKMEESTYWTSRDVLKLMNEALAKPTETFEERLVRLIPTTVKDIFEGLDDNAKKYYLLQAKLYPNLNQDLLVEHFWVSRDWSKYTKINENKVLLNETKYSSDDKLSDAAVLSIMNRMKQL